jgi:peptidoglycan/xylan/chitin deacetylase (PgdA/CDA1 family)
MLWALLACFSHPEAPLKRVALTIDDLPWQVQKGQEAPDRAGMQALNARLREQLQAAGAPAAVFFNCGLLEEGDGIAEAWAASGAEVGNHTWSHAGLHRVDLADWLEDSRRCQEWLGERVGAPRWFRYPFLSMGNDPETSEAAALGIASLGLRHAPVTVATSEWVHAFAWREARGDAQRQADIAADLRRHHLEALEAAHQLAIATQGRPVAQITLLHANELVAEQLGELIDDLRGAGWTLITLEEALSDPVYALPDRWGRRGGYSWLQRVRPDFDPKEDWFSTQEEEIQGRWR